MAWLHKLSQEDRNILRTVVKQVHMKHFPKEFCTDYEADKLISSLAPSTLDKLEKIGKDYRVDRI
jgi:hypothetical protein|tara:strand:+ start:1309 stop:1503 length:195 start_codon:yes stop_codon:yes gene_type:complete